MQSHSGDVSLKVKKEEDDFTVSSVSSHLDNTPQKPVEVAPWEKEGDDVQVISDDDDQSDENAQSQLVLYNPEANSNSQIELVPETTECQPPSFPSFSSLNPPSRVLPSVGAFTVQCANCFKWRLIPTQEKYEEIRENISQLPFVCETAREWRPDISCDDPADISQDGSRLWAIDKPNIAQPPPGWQRLLRIRGEGSTKFADVYYAAPSGKRLRSTVEVQKYLLEHPEYIRAGVNMAQFSFQIPKPLQENYVRKRPARVMPAYDSAGLGVTRTLEPTEVNPLSWAGPIGSTELRIGGPELSAPYFEAPLFHPLAPPAKKQAIRTPSRQMYSSNPVYNQPKIKVEEPKKSWSDSYEL